MRDNTIKIIDNIAKAASYPDVKIVTNKFSREYWTPSELLLFAVSIKKNGELHDNTNQTKRNKNR